MASEYFGHNSGQYFDHDVVAAMENHPWSDAGLTRTGIEGTFAGGSVAAAAKAFITKDHIKGILEKYKASEKCDFKLAADVYGLIIAAVVANLDILLSETGKVGGGGKNKLTMAVLYRTLTKNAKKFAHMSYVWK